jgi:spermidine/putrescine transport system permease protein
VCAAVGQKGLRQIMTDRARTIVFTAPIFIVFALFFALPLAYFFIQSFWRLSLFKLTPDFSFHNYQAVFTDYLGVLFLTLFIAFVIATATAVLAFAFSYFIRFKAGRYAPVLLFATLLTMFGGYLVKIYAWKTILGTNGILNSGLLGLGVISEPLSWLIYNPSAVVITLVHYLLPFAVLQIYGGLRAIGDVEIEAARDLGASSWKTLTNVILPRCQTGLLAAFVLTFLIAAGDYVTPRLVGGPYTQMIGSFAESQYIMSLNAPQGSAMAVSIIAISMLVVALIATALNRALRPA